MFFITAFLGQPHGSAKSARDFSKALLATQKNVGIVSPLMEDFGNNAAGYDLAMPTWYPYVHRPVKGWGFLTPSGIFRELQRRKNQCRIACAVAGDSVIINGWASYKYWKDLALTKHRHSAIIIRESPRHFDYHDRPDTFKAMLAGFSNFDSLIFVSDRLRAEWTQYGELASKPSFYLPNSCEEEDVDLIKRNDRVQIRHQLQFSDEDFVVICPGTLEKRKGQDIVLNAIPEIIDVIPNFRLVFLGNAGTDWGRSIAEKIDAADYGDHVIRIPAQPSALAYLYAADVLLFPSRAEALPRTILEGMAFGMPIIATKVDGIPELIENGVTGWLFDSDDPASMVTALNRVESEPEETRKISSMAERRYREFFSRRRQIERVETMLYNWFGTDGSSNSR